MSTITSTPINTAAASNTGAGSGAVDNAMIANNFQTFLTLLTTQLKNQNPLDPLDTNQFTQQLVQFVQVEQQLKSNDQLAALVSLQKTSQQMQALGFVGATVAVDGSTTKLANGEARWAFDMAKPASTTVTITSATGQLAYSGTNTVQAGRQSFVWDGRGNNGSQWPDGAYKMSITAKDASGQTVAVSTEVEGVVDSVDFTQNPPILSIGGQSFPLDKIKRVTRGA